MLTRICRQLSFQDNEIRASQSFICRRTPQFLNERLELGQDFPVGDEELLLQAGVPVGPVAEHLAPGGAVRVLVLANGLGAHLGAVAVVRGRHVTGIKGEIIHCRKGKQDVTGKSSW